MQPQNNVLLKDSISEYILYISSVKGFSAHTVTGYSTDLSHLLALTGEERLVADITLEDLRGAVGALSKAKYSASSINRFIASVRSLFAYCKKIGYISKNPAQELKTLRGEKVLPRYMSEQEVQDLCNLPQEKEILWETRDKALFEMFYSSGCRVTELKSLKLKDFSNDFTEAVVRGKGSKDRKVFFEKQAVSALKLYLADRKSRFPDCKEEFVFLNQHGKELSVNGIWYIVNRYSGQEGTGKHISPHAFRHTFATAMLNNGADIRVVQEMLGHSSLSTTQRYTHVTKKKLIDVYNQAFPHSGE